MVFQPPQIPTSHPAKELSECLEASFLLMFPHLTGLLGNFGDENWDHVGKITGLIALI